MKQIQIQGVSQDQVDAGPSDKTNIDKNTKLILPNSIKKFAEEMRKVRLSQRPSTYQEAYEQCRRVERRG